MDIESRLGSTIRGGNKNDIGMDAGENVKCHMTCDLIVVRVARGTIWMVLKYSNKQIRADVSALGETMDWSWYYY
jgi:hypothetical protein